MANEFMKAQEFDFEKHELTRSRFSWGSFGKSGGEPMKGNLLKNLSTNHIYNILRTQSLEYKVHCMFVLELCYRIEEKI